MFGFTSEESVPYFGIFVMVSYILFSNYRKGYRELWSPLSVIAIVFTYYCLLGPYQTIASGKTYDRLLNMRPFYSSAFWGALSLIIACVVGFNLNNKDKSNKRIVQLPDPKFLVYGRYICLIAFVLFTISTGGNVANLINPLDAEAVESVGGGLANYLGLSLNFFIPGIAFLLIYTLRTNNGWIWLLVSLVIATGIFISLGFRYRLVLLFGSMAIVYYLNAKRKPNILVALISFFLFITLMGAINISRQYGSGLDTNRLTGDTESYYESGLSESRIFQTSGAIIDIVPERHPHAGFAPLISTLFFPLPRAIYKEKNSAKYLLDSLDAIYGKKVSTGSAFMAYGEYYLAFGWLGILGGGFLIGWFYKKLWRWFLSDFQNPLHIVVYSVSVSYLYVILSRGYLPQVTMLFFFSVFPVYVIYWIARRRSRASFISRLKPHAQHHSYHQ